MLYQKSEYIILRYLINCGKCVKLKEMILQLDKKLLRIFILSYQSR